MADDLTAREVGTALMAFTPEETEIMNAAATFVAEVLPLDRLHGAAALDLSPEVRLMFGELGWFALALPEELGGSGLSAVEHALFFRELGRHCGPLDVLAQTLAANVAVEDADLRNGLISGQLAVALAVRDGESYRLFGAPDADLAVSVEPQGASLFDLAKVETQVRPGLDPATSMRVCAPPEGAVARRPGPAVWDMGQLAVAAMLVGLAETALDLIVEYAKVRETFGRKIGSYQAVRHPCADMALRAEAARCQLWYAAASLKGDRPDAQAQLAAAKHLANEAALANADWNIQLHGGIGVTDEHHAHLLLKRALLLKRILGSKHMVLEQLLHATLED